MQPDSQENPMNDEQPGTDRSLVYMGIGLAVIILVMGYLTWFVDDPWKVFRKQETPVVVNTDSLRPLSKASAMSDEEVKQSLTKFIEAFYFDQRRGYFDPPSYFAPITETYFNFHNLTYARVKEIYWSRKADMENLQRKWDPSSLEFTRAEGRITATYWTSEQYFRPSQNAQQSADVKYELVMDASGKIVSIRELEVQNFVSSMFGTHAADSTQAVPSAETEQPAVVNESAVTAPTEVADNKVYELGTVDVPPEFPGGQPELVRFLNKNLRYPVRARDSHVEGRVFTGFTIEKNGMLSDIRVLRGIGSGCDEEALRVIHLLPRWKPALVAGKPVRNAYVLSVTFRVENQ